MRIILEKLGVRPEIFMRDCGYRLIENPHQGGETSFARSLNWGHFYPRFHIYLNSLSQGLEINLHLDMKKPSYQGVVAHSAEYDGELVENEVRRIQKLAQNLVLTNKFTTSQVVNLKKKKSFWDKVFGEDEE